MEVFINNLDPRATKERVEDWLTPILEQVDINIFDLRKGRGKSFANLTIPDVTKAQKLILKTQTHPQLPRHPHTGKPARFSKGRYEPDALLLKVLRKEEREWSSREKLPNLGPNGRGQNRPTKQINPVLRVKSIECGRWEAQDGQRYFVPYSNLDIQGSLVKQGRALLVKANCTSSTSYLEILFEHMSIQSIVVPKAAKQRSFILTLNMAPKIYGPNVQNAVAQGGSFSPQLITGLFSNLLLNGTEPQNSRLSKLPGTDRLVAGTCLTYRFGLDPGSHIDDLARQIQFLTFRQVDLYAEDIHQTPTPAESFFVQVERLERAVIEAQFNFATRFQIQALWSNAVLSPGEVQQLLDRLNVLRNNPSKDYQLPGILRSLHFQLPVAEPGTAASNTGVQKACDILFQNNGMIHPDLSINGSNGVAIHRVLVTPTGKYLYGPDKETPNRVLRQYPGKEDCFLRVSFTDESGDKIQFNAEASNEKILRGRFLSILQTGLVIACERFDFLGFSHSSLRSQTCWFMRPFVHRGSEVTARSVIASLGDFSHIQCPAKCAARIGQAFSDTEKGITIQATDVRTVPDIIAGRFTFTDGCGTISQALLSGLKQASSPRGHATLYQVRYQGAKGMLSLDSRLSGRQMCLRKSMIKFTGSPSNEIEICGKNSRPLLFKLNRPVIKILEDLGVKHDAFETIQEQAVEKLRRSARSTHSAIDFFCFNMSDNSNGMAELVKCLVEMGIDVTEDQFIRDVIRALIEVQLREIKFRSRIPVNQAVTLYGICDETGFLKEGQVYVTFETGSESHAFLQGRIVVTRSPALHTGDVQIATAVAAPPGSPLLDLTNCIVFSQHGERDMPSMLGGGDLDGDLFNVIYDDELIPEHSDAPAAYPAVEAVDVGRPVRSDDMTAFFIDFMENDQLGRIATLHQVYADREVEGTRSAMCLKLASLHSAAVDFSKSGRPVNFRVIPKTPDCRPDFMVPSVGSKVHRGIKEAEEATSSQSEDSGRYRYYESDRILGKLFRSVNEDEFFGELQDDDISIFSREGMDDVMGGVWHLVSNTVSENQWEEYLDMAQQVKDYYNSMLRDIMSQYAVGNSQFLTEKEVLIGTIIGRSGASNKRQREQSELMKARYKREVQDIRRWMKAQTDEDPDAYLLLAVACLSLIGISQEQKDSHFGDHLRSFAWFSAAICVPKLTTTSKKLEQATTY